MKKKRVFVTGAAGFVGFHLANALLDRGDEVLGLDNFNSYYNPSLKRKRAAELKKREIDVIEGDICDANYLEEILEKFKPTHLVHLAAQAGVRYSLTNPQAYVKANLEGFVNILESCRKFKIPLTYASSSSVYGRNDRVPFAITDNTDRQTNLYGVTKKTNELMAETYHYLYGLQVTGLRFFTVYGPWGRPDMAYFSFAKAIIEGQPIDVFAEGKLQRDFTYIDDIIQGTIAAVDLSSPCALFNLGNHQPVEVNELIALLELSLGKKAIKRFLPMQAGDMEKTYADISESTQKLGFVPKTSLAKGIERFVTWFKNYQG
jgi:UDP-glucuronate 4-epimerase